MAIEGHMHSIDLLASYLESVGHAKPKGPVCDD